MPRKPAHLLIINHLADTTPKVLRERKWGVEHAEAYLHPKGVERAIVGGIDAWATYADLYYTRFEGQIGTDHVLGPAWESWGLALITLLNGDHGRLDAGTLDTLIRKILKHNGFSGER